MKILVSACLLGNKVRYNGSDASCECNLLDQWKAEGRIIPFCPEIAGGFPVPRPAAEIIGRDGLAVIDGGGQVFDIIGHDVTGCFIDGAAKALEAARKNGVKLAVLKEGSPSCGSTYIYDGIFSGVRKDGQGVTTALLEKNGNVCLARMKSKQRLDIWHKWKDLKKSLLYDENQHWQCCEMVSFFNTENSL